MADDMKSSAVGVILDLVVAGAKKLIELVPVWMNASAEKRIEIEAKTRSLVGGLDDIFDAADKKDDAATQAAKDAIKNAGQK